MSARNSTEVSHGRGGAGNIGPDSTQYVDGEIVREGVAGDHHDGAFSTGRGGAANIGSPKIPATERSDREAIPDAALRPGPEGENFHVGRGGQGNIHEAEAANKKKSPVGLADKLKNKLFKSKSTKENTGSTA
ncbi:hypothetical protein PVAG01_09238 [Phlyctema vagabunda]|uniref:Uncharacterized protein n=1 Tax=Phlyctema vagabunda TaxID=108571 RepID=A0ABR4P767_9HELO